MSWIDSFGAGYATGSGGLGGRALTLRQALGYGGLMLAAAYFGLRYWTKDEQRVPGWSRAIEPAAASRQPSVRGVYR
jgi:hypothetical protein